MERYAIKTDIVMNCLLPDSTELKLYNQIINLYLPKKKKKKNKKTKYTAYVYIYAISFLVGDMLQQYFSLQNFNYIEFGN